MPSTRKQSELYKINILINNLKGYNQLVLNINSTYITKIYNNFYILVKLSNKEISIKRTILEESKYNINSYNFKEIDRTNWKVLWSQKVDYIEYQMNHICNKYKIIRNSINYYIGLAENAIQYLPNIQDTSKLKIVPSHKRIEKKDFNSPLNIIVDYQSRDIAEYLKYIFFEGNYNYAEIKEIILKSNLDGISYQLLFARLLFPTYFFDIYDSIINGNIKENKILNIIKKIKNYETYLKKIYLIINEQKKIPEIKWLWVYVLYFFYFRDFINN